MGKVFEMNKISEEITVMQELNLKPKTIARYVYAMFIKW